VSGSIFWSHARQPIQLGLKILVLAAGIAGDVIDVGNRDIEIVKQLLADRLNGAPALRIVERLAYHAFQDDVLNARLDQLELGSRRQGSVFNATPGAQKKAPRNAELVQAM
jgi:hypothetical protein